MAKSSNDNIRRPVRKRGSTTGSLIGVRLQPSDLAALDQWITKQDAPLTRPEALRAMLALVLKVKPKRRQSPDQQMDRAREMAGKVIERKIDPAAPEDERKQRKRRLLKGPEELRGSRADRKTKK